VFQSGGDGVVEQPSRLPGAATSGLQDTAGGHKQAGSLLHKGDCFAAGSRKSAPPGAANDLWSRSSLWSRHPACSFVGSLDPQPRPIKATAAAFRAPAGWVESLAREREPAVGADGGTHSETFAVGLDASLDVAEVVLEGAHGDGELVAKVIEEPLLITQALKDLLATGECRAHGSVVGGRSGPPDASHPRTGRPST